MPAQIVTQRMLESTKGGSVALESEIGREYVLL